MQTQPLPVLAWGVYQGPLKRAIAQLKYNQNTAIAHYFGNLLADLWLSQPNSPRGITVLPIPLHPDRYRQRGFNQATLIAQSFCHVTGLPLLPHGLQRTKATQAQFSLSRAQRFENLESAFSLDDALRRFKPSSSFLLLDDIYTTGATLIAARQTLTRHQFQGVQAMVVAKAIAPKS